MQKDPVVEASGWNGFRLAFFHSTSLHTDHLLEEKVSSAESSENIFYLVFVEHHTVKGVDLVLLPSPWAA